eukprot:scaffold26096_cov31-Tisochrysis_lutea.AAC.1
MVDNQVATVWPQPAVVHHNRSPIARDDVELAGLHLMRKDGPSAYAHTHRSRAIVRVRGPKLRRQQLWRLERAEHVGAVVPDGLVVLQRIVSTCGALVDVADGLALRVAHLRTPRPRPTDGECAAGWTTELTPPLPLSHRPQSRSSFSILYHI